MSVIFQTLEPETVSEMLGVHVIAGRTVMLMPSDGAGISSYQAE